MSNSGISEEHWLYSGWDVRNVLQWQRKMSLLNEYCEILISAQWLGCKRCPGHGRRNVHLGLDPSRLSCRCFQSCAPHLISWQAWNWGPEGWGGSFSGLNGILIPIRWNYWHLILFTFVKSVLLCPCYVAIFVKPLLLLNCVSSWPESAYSSITDTVVTATHVRKTLVLRYFRKCHLKSKVLWDQINLGNCVSIRVKQESLRFPRAINRHCRSL